MNSWMSEGDQSLLVVNVDVTEKKRGVADFHCDAALHTSTHRDAQ